MVMLFGKELKKYARMLNLLSIKTMNLKHQTNLLAMIYLKKVILIRDLLETVGL
jgi:hypothetical protein